MQSSPWTDHGTDALVANDREYERLLDWMTECQRLDAQTVLHCTESAAAYAATWHTGRFSDGAIENVVMKVGTELVPGAAPSQETVGKGTGPGRRVLHLATAVGDVGGHTRTILNWIRADSSSRHSLLVTRQTAAAVPRWLVAAVLTSGGAVHSLAGRASLAAARELRALARSVADAVVLHHSCYDVIPVAAFAQPGGPPVAVLNHADHVFWLGCGIADLVINQREAGRQLGEERRLAQRHTVLPIPLGPPAPPVPGGAARRELGIPDDALVLLSVGRGEKYRPAGPHDFFRTAGTILAALPRAHLFIVGLTEGDYARICGGPRNPRIHCVGALSDPSRYRAAADLYLEGFPFGSPTALLEAAVTGLPPVLPYQPLDDILTTNHGLELLITRPADEDEYVAAVVEAAGDRCGRLALGRRLQEHVRMCHTGDGWLALLARVYAVLDGLTHAPRPLPTATSMRAPVDIALGTWHAGLNRSPAAHIPPTPEGLIRQMVLGGVYGARRDTRFRAAVTLLRSGTRRWSWDRRLVLEAAKLAIDWASRGARLGRTGS